MEQSRLLIAIALSFAVFMLWNIFFSPQLPPAPTVEESRQPSTPAPTPEADPQAAVPAPPSGAIAPSAQPERPARTFTIDTSRYSIKVSEKGAAVVDMVLKNYRESVEPDSPPKSLISEAMVGGSVLLAANGDLTGALASGIYQTEENRERIVLGSEPFTLTFVQQTPEGVQVQKAYTFSPDSYLIGLSVNLSNGAGAGTQAPLHLVLRNILTFENQSYGFEGPSALINNGLVQIKQKEIEEEKPQGLIRWVANETRYFLNGVIPQEALQGQVVSSYQQKLLTNHLIIAPEPGAAQQNQHYDFNLFMGPKSYSTLRSLNNDLDRAIDFGWFDFIAKPCLWFMNFVYGFIPNYGIAIIILTIVTRLAFWPLAAKSYKSMSEMRKLQPLMQEIREKYKNDKARMNQEVMGLYRTYKINPMGGCLPMLIQLPVFFALYQMLYQAIELRHAPFFGWIQDLSAPDRLFDFGFSIPLMQPPYGIPVLTLIMGGTMFLQQKMSPPPGDPAQARMMMLLPIVFTFIFINFSSGLVLYWLVSNVLSIGQQYYTQKKMA
jgi:YidC/Oxa1 family membrane protein insertase